jgi:hypothetical protein
MLQIIAKKYGSDWLVPLLIDDLLDWNNWMWNQRRQQPQDLMVLGNYDHLHSIPEK